MSTKQRRSGTTVHVADGVGGVRSVADYRFDADSWRIREAIPAAQAEDYMAHLHAESTARGWSSSGLGQLDADENSGSITLHLMDGQTAPTIEIVWEKTRGGRLHVRARPGGDPDASAAVTEEFFATVAARLRSERFDREHRRAPIVYEGLAWTGELWLNDALRLGPPSRFPESLLGHQVVIVDAMVEGIGSQGITARFQRMLRDLRLVLSPILGIHLEQEEQWASEWVPEIDAQGRIVDVRLRPVGYAEIGHGPEMPTRAAAAPIPVETVRRPGLGRYGIWADDRVQRVPHDIKELWASFDNLQPSLKNQFLNACNAYSIARSMWPAQRTAYAVFLVIACEALKPSGKTYDNANAYDVIASLAGVETTDMLRKLRIEPQTTRSQHVHRGVLVADEITPLLFGDPFGDPSFDEMIGALSQVARTCLVEWLRHRGQYTLTWWSHPKSLRQHRARRRIKEPRPAKQLRPQVRR